MLVAGLGFEQFTANVAEFYNLPLATLDFFPMRAHGQLVPFLPAPLGRSLMTLFERLSWSGAVKKSRTRSAVSSVCRRQEAPGRSGSTNADRWRFRRMKRCVSPGLLRNGRIGILSGPSWALLRWNWSQTPMRRSCRGLPPEHRRYFFSFGSIPVGSPADTFALIAASCTQLGERALVSSGGTDFSGVPQSEHVKVVAAVNYATVFPTLPQSNTPRRLGHYGRRPSRWRPSGHPLNVLRSAGLWSCSQTFEGGHL